MYKQSKRVRTRRQRARVFFFVMGLILILLIALTLYIRHIYYQNLSPPSTSQTSQIVTVPNGASVDQIADLLHKDNLIQSPWSFEWYVRAAGLGDSLEAGTYALNPAQDVQGVVGTLTSGKVATKLVPYYPANGWIRSAPH